jgi:ferredoxin
MVLSGLQAVIVYLVFKRFNNLDMNRYRVFIDKDRCIDCGIDAGRCPTHAHVLAQLLSDKRVERSEETNTSIIPEDLYLRVKRAAEGCPVKAIIIEKID